MVEAPILAPAPAFSRVLGSSPRTPGKALAIEHSGVSPLWLTQRELKDKASSYLSWPGSLQRVGRGYSGDSSMATLFQGLLTHPLAPLQLPVLRVHLQFPPGPRWDPTKAFEPHSSGKRRIQNYSPDLGLCTRFSSAHTQRQKQP